jgi:hypothetical protein
MLIKNKDIAAKNHRHKVVTVVVRVAEEKNNLDSTVQRNILAVAACSLSVKKEWGKHEQEESDYKKSLNPLDSGGNGAGRLVRRCGAVEYEYERGAPSGRSCGTSASDSCDSAEAGAESRPRSLLW